MGKSNGPVSDALSEKATKAPVKASSVPASDDGLDNPSGINEKALLRKLDRKLLPAVTLLYLLSFLDRSNGVYPLPLLQASTTDSRLTVANARIEGLTTDLKMSMGIVCCSIRSVC